MTAITEGTQIGPYRVIRMLGRGGMGAVFEAIHEAIERRVAIKVLHAEYAADAEFIERFFNEARAVNIVDHPGLVQISDYGRMPGGTAYIVMEYLKGETLAQRLKRAQYGMPIAEVVHLSWQVADSLAAAHEKSIVHRDLKPDNIMVIPDRHMPSGERTKLLDFGIAKVAKVGGGAAAPTQLGALMGTPAYMSPEQCAGAGGVDAWSDVYSLGCVIYQMLSGHPPFVGEGAGEVMGMQQFVPPEPLARAAPATPAPLAVLTHRLLAKRPAERPPIQEVESELDALCMQYPLHNRRASTAHSNGARHQSRAGADVNAATVYPSGTSRPSGRSTLGASSGEEGAPSAQRKPLWGGHGMAAVLAVGLGVWIMRPHPSPSPAISPPPAALGPAVPIPSPPSLKMSAPAAPVQPESVASLPSPTTPSLPSKPMPVTKNKRTSLLPSKPPRRTGRTKTAADYDD